MRLGLAPNAFWALTIAEWRWLIDAALTTGDALDAAALNSLSHLYPDQ